MKKEQNTDEVKETVETKNVSSPEEKKPNNKKTKEKKLKSAEKKGGILGKSFRKTKVFLIILLVIIFSFNIILNMFAKGKIETAVKEQTNLDLTLGKIGVNLFTGKLNLKDIDLKAEERDLFNAKELAVNMSLIKLLKKDIKIEKIHLDSPYINVDNIEAEMAFIKEQQRERARRNRNKRPNQKKPVPTDEKKSSASNLGFEIERITIEDINIIKDSKRYEALHEIDFKFDPLRYADNSLQLDAKLDLSGKENKNKIEIKADVDLEKGDYKAEIKTNKLNLEQSIYHGDTKASGALSILIDLAADGNYKEKKYNVIGKVDLNDLLVVDGEEKLVEVNNFVLDIKEANNDKIDINDITLKDFFVKVDPLKKSATEILDDGAKGDVKLVNEEGTPDEKTLKDEESKNNQPKEVDTKKIEAGEDKVADAKKNNTETDSKGEVKVADNSKKTDENKLPVEEGVADNESKTEVVKAKEPLPELSIGNIDISGGRVQVLGLNIDEIKAAGKDISSKNLDSELTLSATLNNISKIIGNFKIVADDVTVEDSYKIDGDLKLEEINLEDLKGFTEGQGVKELTGKINLGTHIIYSSTGLNVDGTMNVNNLNVNRDAITLRSNSFDLGFAFNQNKNIMNVVVKNLKGDKLIFSQGSKISLNLPGAYSLSMNTSIAGDNIKVATGKLSTGGLSLNMQEPQTNVNIGGATVGLSGLSYNLKSQSISANNLSASINNLSYKGGGQNVSLKKISSLQLGLKKSGERININNLKLNELSGLNVSTKGGQNISLGGLGSLSSDANINGKNMNGNISASGISSVSYKDKSINFKGNSLSVSTIFDVPANSKNLKIENLRLKGSGIAVTQSGKLVANLPSLSVNLRKYQGDLIDISSASVSGGRIKLLDGGKSKNLNSVNLSVNNFSTYKSNNFSAKGSLNYDGLANLRLDTRGSLNMPGKFDVNGMNISGTAHVSSVELKKAVTNIPSVLTIGFSSGTMSADSKFSLNKSYLKSTNDITLKDLKIQQGGAALLQNSLGKYLNQDLKELNFTVQVNSSLEDLQSNIAKVVVNGILDNLTSNLLNPKDILKNEEVNKAVNKAVDKVNEKIFKNEKINKIIDTEKIIKKDNVKKLINSIF